MRAFVFAAALAACTAAPVKQGETPSENAETVTNDIQAGLERMPTWGEARAAGVDFRGIGQEPGWIIDIYGEDRIVLLLDYGETLVVLPRPAPTYPAEGATRFETQSGAHTASITIRRAPCADAMSGEAYPASVDVVIDGRTLRGCGRNV
jgi:putative lipoprotein